MVVTRYSNLTSFFSEWNTMFFPKYLVYKCFPLTGLKSAQLREAQNIP